MKISNQALSKMVVINSGCRTLMPKKEENLRYVFQLVLSGKSSFQIEEIEKFLPQPSNLWEGLEFFAKTQNAKEVDRDLVYRFFGTEVHSQMVEDQIAAGNLRDEFADKFRLVHMLLPVVIQSQDGPNDFSACYCLENEQVCIVFKGLMVHPVLSVKVKVGDLVLVHYAMIVDLLGRAEGLAHDRDGQNEIGSVLYAEQCKIKPLMDAGRKIKEINYHTFWNLRKWTENLLKIVY